MMALCFPDIEGHGMPLLANEKHVDKQRIGYIALPVQEGASPHSINQKSETHA